MNSLPRDRQFAIPAQAGIHPAPRLQANREVSAGAGTVASGVRP
jgi:hypothetical protein